jgi:glutamine synthetase
MDGSSIRGWVAIHESDMLLVPDPNTAFMDPFAETSTLVMYGDVKDYGFIGCASGPLRHPSHVRDKPR